MNRPTKLMLMFAPFAVFFAALFFMVDDLRHPALAEDQCFISGVGPGVQRFKAQGRYIYRHSEDALKDVSLQCNRMGTLLLNDGQLAITPIKTGQAAQVGVKKYRYLPDRWMVSVTTGKPEDAAGTP